MARTAMTSRSKRRTRVRAYQSREYRPDLWLLGRVIMSHTLVQFTQELTVDRLKNGNVGEHPVRAANRRTGRRVKVREGEEARERPLRLKHTRARAHTHAPLYIELGHYI